MRTHVVVAAVVIGAAGLTGCNNESATAPSPSPEISTGFGTEPSASVTPNPEISTGFGTEPDSSIAPLDEE